MTDRPRFPDEAHEEVWRAAQQAIADSATNATGVDDAYWLTSTLFDLAGSLLTTADDLGSRLADLEQWRADTAAATGDVLAVAGDDDAGWTWARTAPNGVIVAVSDGTYSRAGDAWRGAHRANPDL